MLLCFKCGGTFSPQTSDKHFTLFGIEKIEIKNLKTYVCDQCGAELYPDKTLAKIKQVQSQYFSNATGLASDEYSAI
jgi:YgiT-type zinc finger domain-containing protein